MVTSYGGARVEVQASPLHGRGLFASVEIPPAAPIGAYPLLILSHQETAALKATRVFHYVFYVDERTDGMMRAAVAFGVISMCNHSPEANAAFHIDTDRQEVTLTAMRVIRAGEEILIDYEDFADETL